MNNPVFYISKLAKSPRHLYLWTLCFSSIPSLASLSSGCPRSRWLRRWVTFRIEDMVAGLFRRVKKNVFIAAFQKISWRQGTLQSATEATSTNIKFNNTPTLDQFVERRTGKVKASIHHSPSTVLTRYRHSQKKMPPPKTAPKAAKKPTTTRSAIADVVAREYTIHLHKRVGPST